MISIPAWAWHIHIKTHKYTSGDGGGPTALSECKREYVCIKTLTVCVEWTTCQTRYRGNFMFESVCVSACFGSQCGTHRVYYAWPKANHSDGNDDGTTQRECEWLSGECREHKKKTSRGYKTLAYGCANETELYTFYAVYSCQCLLAVDDYIGNIYNTNDMREQQSRTSTNIFDE